MRRLSLLGLLSATALLGGCSLINSPDEVKPGGTGGSGGSGPSATHSSGTGTTPECTKAEDCDVEPCQVAECKSGVCKLDQAPNNTPCDDGVKCTVNDVCMGGACTAGPMMTCTPTNDCNTSACVEATGTCADTPVADDTPCNDNDPCTATSTCLAGQCASGPSCKSTECLMGVCTANGCVDMPVAEGTSCGNTTCSVGQCDDTGKCLITPINVGAFCDDGQFCTKDETCSQFGQCVGGVPKCPTLAPCLQPVCDEVAQTCTNVAIQDGEACDDNDACSAGETCHDFGICGPGVPSQNYFKEGFANNAAGWTLGVEWQIGAATASTGGQDGADPAQDHTPTGDNGVAGVVIGGNASTGLHPPVYLTSPVVNTSGVPGSLYLVYYRWLNSDYTPYMRNMIEVFDGNAWIEVWTTGGYPGIIDSPPLGTGWTFVSHDITPYKNSGMQFRFGFEITNGGVYTIGSWNIDDVALWSSPCPNPPP